MSVLNVTVEATDLFSHLFTNEAYLAQSKSARQRQGICPDFWIPSSNRIMELKSFSYSPVRYKSKKCHRERRHAANLRERSIQTGYIAKARKADRMWCNTPEGEQGPIEQRLLQFGPVLGLTAGGFGEMNSYMDVLVDLIATKAAEDKWRLMGATSLAQAKQTFVIRVRRSIGVEAARGLARLRLANLTHVHTFRRGESACSLRQREKSYYYDAREAHYNRFGPHAWFDPSMRGRTSHHF